MDIFIIMKMIFTREIAFYLQNINKHEIGRYVMSESKEMVRGTFLITISILITKVLGVLFIIPFNYLIGGQGKYGAVHIRLCTI